MDTSNFITKRENIFSTFFIGWLAFLSTLRISLKQLLSSVLGQLFGIFLISLAPILEYREMIDLFEAPDGWLYITISVTGVIFFLYYLWRFFVVLAGANLLARDIYDNRAIANLSFYTSDILRRKGSYIIFLTGCTFIALLFTGITALILYIERNIVVYNLWTNLASLSMVILQTFVLVGYLLFSNIALQGYTFNRIIGFGRTIKKIIDFICENIVSLTFLVIITTLFSNIIAYLVQGLLSFLIINPLNLYSDNSIAIAIRFTAGFVINAFVILLLQYIYARFYLNAEEDSLKMF